MENLPQVVSWVWRTELDLNLILARIENLQWTPENYKLSNAFDTRQFLDYNKNFPNLPEFQRTLNRLATEQIEDCEGPIFLVKIDWFHVFQILSI